MYILQILLSNRVLHYILFSFCTHICIYIPDVSIKYKICNFVCGYSESGQNLLEYLPRIYIVFGMLML